MNRCLAEGRERFRRLLSRSEDGSRCEELLPLLSTYCDGELDDAGKETVREHLRACSSCRATMRAYRAAPAAVAAFAPALPTTRSLLERAHDLFAGLYSRLPGSGGAGEAGIAQVAAAGGTRGAGMAALAKALAICAGTVGGAAACVATGIAPAPLDLEPEHSAGARVERVAKRAVDDVTAPIAASETPPEPEASMEPKPEPQSETEPEAPAPPLEDAEAGGVEYVAPPPEPRPAATPAEPSSPSSDSAAGEFGP